ncbi:hypothetical protein C8J56DRAFT_885635 [Mycena floridula]|nr:hypothetical protein C8J56DRAFT_885635 [Mycena floridula]
MARRSQNDAYFHQDHQKPVLFMDFRYWDKGAQVEEGENNLAVAPASAEMSEGSPTEIKITDHMIVSSAFMCMIASCWFYSNPAGSGTAWNKTNAGKKIPAWTVMPGVNLGTCNGWTDINHGTRNVQMQSQRLNELQPLPSIY